MSTLLSVIHKHTLEPFDCTLRLAPDAQPLTVGVQGDRVVLWERHPVRTDGVTVARRFVSVWTGQPFDLPDGRYIGTVTTARDGLVWHVFEAAQ